jgi:hypothetical protein
MASFRIARNGCFRAAALLPAAVKAADITQLRFHAHPRPPREGEPPPRAGRVTLTRINRLFLLGDDYAPGPNLFGWTGAATIEASRDLTLAIAATPRPN